MIVASTVLKDDKITLITFDFILADCVKTKQKHS